ncbi:DUF4263 domain-containing protein [Bradyrhizobium sediminis]|uniref:DUF4263 domain-containing protein n=1 Tax=Bradyrhizobium sediminis TaxID=2840469 RepID=A0A975NZ92_9BRAD|nr:Shedu immune nuclease family protein [Bradyrhizobium sediminis]QWG24143.1 DUF4263 domain-containing protein [Bradyrhizobium sediminis]
MARPRAYKLIGSYGEFTGTKIYYTGFLKTPGFLPASGRGFGGLKHTLELLKKKFRSFTLTITPDENSVTKSGTIYKVRLSAKIVKKYGNRRWEGSRQLNLKLGQQMLAEIYPNHFPSATYHAYQRGMFAEILSNIDERLVASEDRAALTKFVTGASSSTAIDIPTAYQAKQDVQLIYLRRLVEEFEKQIAAGHDEAWWQKYFEKNILFFQESYIRRLEKMNIIVGTTQYPDFCVVTSDGYLDILEIKKPGTTLLKEDTSRHNFYWSTEVAKAISQVENYIDNITKHSDAIRSKLRDDLAIDLRIIKPRGIVVAGVSSEFAGKPAKADDFRLLNEGLKNVQIVPYNELSQRLKNTIVSIEKLSGTQGAIARKPRKGKASKRE